LKTNIIYHADCLKGMQKIPNNSIDMILADLPYGTTACSWDSIIPLEPLWKQYKRIIKDNSAIALTASQPFTSRLVTSNIDWFKYEWIWEKAVGSNFASLKYRPMKEHESILIFSKNTHNYYPIKEKRKGSGAKRAEHKKIHYEGHENKSQGTKMEETITANYDKNNRNPSSIQYFNNRLPQDRGLHPTQKPVALFEYLIKTYTKEGEIVLDNVIGSGTTAVACINTNRKFIGFENNRKYYHIALKRIGKYDKSYYEELPEEEQPKEKGLF
jgi:site-specific DNA-methyltransferase (adenine-specific)